MNSLEQLIAASRTKLGTHQSSLEAARERMKQSNIRLSKEFKSQEVTEELLNKVISL